MLLPSEEDGDGGGGRAYWEATFQQLADALRDLGLPEHREPTLETLPPRLARRSRRPAAWSVTIGSYSTSSHAISKLESFASHVAAFGRPPPGEGTTAPEPRPRFDHIDAFGLGTVYLPRPLERVYEVDCGNIRWIASAERLRTECLFLGNILGLFDIDSTDHDWLIDQGGNPAFAGIHERVAPELQKAFEDEASMCTKLLQAAENALTLGACAFVT